MDHRKKLEWARKHLDRLDESIRIFRESTPCHLTIQFNPKTGANDAYVTQLRPMDPDWSMMVGDIVHGMRSSLDNITYALARKHSGEAAANGSTELQFPICDHPLGWYNPAKKKGQKRRVALLSPLAQAEVERLQPYNGRYPGDFHPLTVLRDLSNIDKHRHIILTYPRGSDLSIKIFGPRVPPGAKFGSGFAGPIEEGTHVGSLVLFDPRTGDRPIPLPTDMEVDPNLALDILFGAGDYTGSVVGVFRGIYDTINTEIFPALENFLL
ncbi:MAG TPA: hypothetical protein VLJ83_08755 [Gemmatimonadaceae bacterium]|nr:hypothetical protein [Gemmatimonadaceae bacterium]